MVIKTPLGLYPPYNFFVAADYSSQLRAGLEYLRQGWKKSLKPRIAFIYPDHPYGSSPIAAGKAHARDLDFAVAGDEHLTLGAIDAEVQVGRLMECRPDFIWVGGTTHSTAVLLKEAGKQGLRTRFIVNQWGNDEYLIDLAGEDADGVLGLQAAACYGDDVPGMKAICEVTRGVPKPTHYVRGWVSMMVLCEGLRIAEARGELTGLGIKNALDTLKDFNTQGLTAPITITADDHRPNMVVRVYEFAGEKMCHLETVTLQRRAEWLGR